MKFPFLINLFLAQCWSAYTLDQNIPVSDEYLRRVQEVVSDIPVEVPVSYDCRFINRWTSSRHPNLFPTSGEFWSRPVMASHNEEYTMWSADQLASISVDQYTKKGNTNKLQLEAFLAGTDVNNIVKGITLSPSGDFDESPMDGQLQLDNERRLISTIAKINPSSDWFSGLNSYSPVMNDRWLSRFTVDSFPWDAGTRDGTMYTFSNPVSVPKVNIFRYTFGTVPENGVFLNTLGDDVLPVAQWRCDLTGTTFTAPPTASPTESNDRLTPTATPTAAPNASPTSGDDNITIPPASSRCSEGSETKFFRYNPRTGLIPRDRPQDCFWLSGQNSKVQRRHCKRGRNFEPFPLDDTPLAKEACPLTCGMCTL